MDEPTQRGGENEGAFLEPTAVVPLTGEVILIKATGVKVCDFWSWAYSDLRMNTTRGMLAQFLVARALGDERATDEGWGNYDVLTPDGIRVEVTSSAYLQGWRQRGLSKLTFGGLTGYSWSDSEGYSAEREVRADVFVFAIHTCRELASYDALDLAAWECRVLPASTIKDLGVRRIGWSTLIKHAPKAVAWTGLRDAVLAAYQAYRLAVEHAETDVGRMQSGKGMLP